MKLADYLILALVALSGVAGAGVLAASALRDEAAYFRTPVEIEGGKLTLEEQLALAEAAEKAKQEADQKKNSCRR